MTMNKVSCPPFLIKYFEEIAGSEGIVDYVIEHEAGSKHGDGFMADMLAVKLTGLQKLTNDPIQLSLICKLIPVNEDRLEMFSSQLAFDREVLFYNEMLPMLQKLQQQYGLCERNGFFGYPRCYAAVGGRKEAVIIMQDIRVDGFALWNRLEMINIEKVRLLMVELGRLHGLSFVLRDQHPDQFERIRMLDDLMLPICGKPRLFSLYMNSFDLAIKVLDDTEHKELLKVIKNSWTTLMKQCADPNLAEPFAVMGHGDCWNNNLMWLDSIKVCLIDWQICRFASPVLDLVYFLVASTDKNFRRLHFDHLIQLYYESLAQIVRHCGSDPERLFRLDDLHDQLRKFGKYGICLSPILVQGMVADPKDIPKVDEMATAPGAATKESFATMDEETSAKYKQRLGDVIDDAKCWGWI